MAYRHIMGMDNENTPDVAQSTSANLPRLAPMLQVLDFTGIIGLGTYPPWADPSYDYKGAPIHFDWRRQLNRTHIVLRYYFDLYIEQLAPLVTGFLVLVIWGGSFRQFGKRLLRQSVLWFPALAGLALYALLRVEGRMLAGFTIALFAACALALRLDKSDSAGKMSRVVVAAVSIVLVSQIVVTAGHEITGFRDNGQLGDWEVVKTLRGMGIVPGDRVSYMGDALTHHAWAHLARVRISAEIPEEEVLNFWAADRTQRAEAMKKLAATGARALITRDVPSTAMSMGWRRIADTDYDVIDLR